MSIFCGSGKDSGILVKMSNVVETLLQPLQLRVDFSCPENIKNMNDHSLLRVLDHCSSPSSVMTLLSLSGFSM